MEALVVLGAGAYLFSALNAPPHNGKIDKSPQEEFETMLERPYDLFVHEARERGMIAQAAHLGSCASRVPWNPSNPPYAIYRAGNEGHDPVETAIHGYASAYEHQRREVAEEASTGRQNFARKRTIPLYNGFTRDVSLKDVDPNAPERRSNIAAFAWMPPTPTDEDRNEAAAMGKAIPYNPDLFTPDAHYFTAPGLPFRYENHR